MYRIFGPIDKAVKQDYKSMTTTTATNFKTTLKGLIILYRKDSQNSSQHVVKYTES